jgi:hypothetical protein
MGDKASETETQTVTEERSAQVTKQAEGSGTPSASEEENDMSKTQQQVVIEDDGRRRRGGGDGDGCACAWEAALHTNAATLASTIAAGASAERNLIDRANQNLHMTTQADLRVIGTAVDNNGKVLAAGFEGVIRLLSQVLSRLPVITPPAPSV